MQVIYLLCSLFDLFFVLVTPKCSNSNKVASLVSVTLVFIKYNHLRFQSEKHVRKARNKSDIVKEQEPMSMYEVRGGGHLEFIPGWKEEQEEPPPPHFWRTFPGNQHVQPVREKHCFVFCHFSH